MILLTGATGFLGEFVLHELLRQGYPTTCFVRETSNIEVIKELNADFVYGELNDKNSIRNALVGKDVLINIVSMGSGLAPTILDAITESNVNRVIFISTTGIFTNLNPTSKGIRIEAERLIKESSLNYTILRPTMIYGTPKDRNLWRLITYIKRFPVLPILGNGNYLQQPVYVEDLAKAIVNVINNPVTFRKEYNVAGERPLTYNELVDIVSEKMRKKTIKIHLPMKLSFHLLKIYESISKNPRLKAEQVLRLNENKAFSIDDAVRDFDYAPIRFEIGIQKEIEHTRM